MKNLAVFDIECYDKNKPFAVGLYDGKTYQMFEGKDCIQEFLEVALKPNKTYYAHNGGRYDFHFLTPYLIEDGYELKIFEKNSRYFRIIIDKPRVNFKDSVMLLPFSLKRLTEVFGVEHQKILLADNPEAKELIYQDLRKLPDWQEYLEHDCKGLYEVLEKFNAFIGQYNAKLKTTLASQAMSIYKNNFAPKKFDIFSQKEDMIRDGYVGGRTEVFKKYGESLFYYDFNSLYPYIMRKYKVPIGTYRVVDCPNSYNTGFIDATIRVDDLEIPFLHYKSSKLLYPTGEFRGVYTYPEIDFAESLGYDINYNYIIEFEESDYIFKDYVDHFYNKKQNATNDIDYQLSKLLLNSLYGKFGQNRNNETIISNPEEILGLTPYDEELNLFKKRSFNKYGTILPHIAAYVTAYARIELYKKFMEVGFDNVFYCDTDSIISSKELSTGNNLGELKLEDEIQEGIFLAPKTYGYINNKDEVVLKCKGFDVEKLSFNVYREALAGKYDNFKVSRWRIKGIKGATTRKGQISDVEKLERTLKHDQDKRVFDGINSKPIQLA